MGHPFYRRLFLFLFLIRLRSTTRWWFLHRLPQPNSSINRAQFCLLCGAAQVYGFTIQPSFPIEAACRHTRIWAFAHDPDCIRPQLFRHLEPIGHFVGGHVAISSALVSCATSSPYLRVRISSLLAKLRTVKDAYSLMMRSWPRRSSVSRSSISTPRRSSRAISIVIDRMPRALDRVPVVAHGLLLFFILLFLSAYYSFRTLP
jgi:hypothetical protein